MEEITALAQSILSIQSEILSSYERRSTQAHAQAAAYAKRAAELQAMRELAENYFRHECQMQALIYQSANGVLDMAIEKGDIGMAKIALTVVKAAKAKDIL